MLSENIYKGIKMRRIVNERKRKLFGAICMYNTSGDSGDKKVSINDFYDKLKAELYEKYKVECRTIGYGLFCEPCPFHKDEKHDALFFDLMANTKGHYFTCMKEPDTYFDEPKAFDETEIQTILELKKQISKNDIQTTRAEVVERHYVSSQIIISIRQSGQEGYKAYRYNENEGIYQELSSGVIKAELQMIYERLWAQKPPVQLLTEMKNKVYGLTAIDGDENIFSNVKGTKLYLPGRVRDIEIDTVTGEVNILQKDPYHRMFTKRLPYDFAIDPPDVAPPELEMFRKYTTPRFYINVLVMLASGLAFRSDAQIFVLYSRDHGTGKSTFFNILENLFSKDLVTRAQPKQFYDQFAESKLIGKSLLILEEYRGGSPTIDETLKRLASKDSTISTNRKYKEYIDAPNTVTILTATNRLKYNTDDKAFLRRLIVTPFTHVWKESEYPSWLRDQNVKERIVLYLAKHVLPDYLTEKLKPTTFPVHKLEQWLTDNDAPNDGVEEFLRYYFYKDCSPENHEAIQVSVESAYQYYLMWTDRMDIIPASDEEFRDKLEFLKVREDWTMQKDGKEMMCMKKSNLEFFL